MKEILSKINIPLLILVLICITIACEQENDHANLSEEPSGNQETKVYDKMTEDKVTIGFSMDTLTEERWLRDRELFKEAVEALGAEVKIVESLGDDALQILQAETLISEGIDVLVIVPHNAESTAMIVKKAHSAGIKVLSYDRLVRNSEVDLYISFDNEMVGELQAKAITSLVPKGNYVYIGGAETDYNAHLLKKGVFNILQPLIDKGDITLVYDQWTKDWVTDNAFANIEEALKVNNNQIDAVISANDATAGRVIEALTVQNLAGKIPVAGQDADLAATQRIVEGTQTMTVYKPLVKLANQAAELAIRMAKGEEIEVEKIINNGKSGVPSVLLSPIAVDQENIAETIIADGFHSEDEVYKNARE